MKTRQHYVELGVVLLAVLTPLFLLANEVDGDEFAKAGSGVFLAAVVSGVAAVYRVWKGKT